MLVAFAAPRPPDPWAPVGRRKRREGAVGLPTTWREAVGRTLPCQTQVGTPGEDGRKRNETHMRNQQQEHSTVSSEQGRAAGLMALTNDKSLFKSSV